MAVSQENLHSDYGSAGVHCLRATNKSVLSQRSEQHSVVTKLNLTFEKIKNKEA